MVRITVRQHLTKYATTPPVFRGQSGQTVSTSQVGRAGHSECHFSSGDRHAPTSRGRRRKPVAPAQPSPVGAGVAKEPVHGRVARCLLVRGATSTGTRSSKRRGPRGHALHFTGPQRSWTGAPRLPARNVAQPRRRGTAKARRVTCLSVAAQRSGALCALTSCSTRRMDTRILERSVCELSGASRLATQRRGAVPSRAILGVAAPPSYTGSPSSSSSVSPSAASSAASAAGVAPPRVAITAA